MSGITRPNQTLVGKRIGNCHDYCGCNVASCCLQCPLEVCKYDDIAAYQAEQDRLRWQRRAERAAALKRQGHHPRLIAKLMETTERTVYRYLAN